DRMSVGRRGEQDAGGQRVANELRAEVDPVGQAVRLDRRPGLDANLEQPLEIDRVRRAVLDDASLRVTDRAHRWMAGRLGHPEGELRARLTLPRMHRRLHPLELAEDVV